MEKELNMASSKTPDIIYTKVDEAPQLASESLLPIIQSFADAAGISVGIKDISLSGRIISAFPERLSEIQKQPDDLSELGELVKKPTANIIKLPNISASVPQLNAAIRELQSQGYDVPNYPEKPITHHEHKIRERYDKIKGSAVNPVLREGNSDRRAASAVKKYAMANPHSMGFWSKASKTRVSSMTSGDFRSNEFSVTINEKQSGYAQIKLESDDGANTILKKAISLSAGTVVDATFMSVRALKMFFKDQIAATYSEGTLFSLHLKATMMKVSDPIIFGHAVKAFLKPVFEAHEKTLQAAGIDPNFGLATMFELLDGIKEGARIKTEITALLAERPSLYMVNSDKGISNLHVPSDVIIDASMPALIRAGGKAWGPDGSEEDTNCIIPDSSYASIYEEAIKYCKEKGALDPATIGSVQNVGLMAQKAEEYGSHPTTFEIPFEGTVKVIAANGDILHTHRVEKGDIWRLASTQRGPIENWIDLAIERQKTEECLAIFWLDENRAHDSELLKIVKPILSSSGIDSKFKIMAPREATRTSFETIQRGKNTIAITGNVLRDYLTDLFPILELGTSAKMLSIVKLMNGGGLFETGAGGSAPKHVEQLIKENHLRWDSIGEFCALGESLKYFGSVSGEKKAGVLGKAVDVATQGILDKNKSPGRKVGQPDNRDSHFYFALYWAQALAEQKDDMEIANHFGPIALALSTNEEVIISEMHESRGSTVELGGYYHTDNASTKAVMTASNTMRQILLNTRVNS